MGNIPGLSTLRSLGSELSGDIGLELHIASICVRSVSTLSWIMLTRLATKVFHLEDVDLSQCKVNIESDQAKMFSNLINSPLECVTNAIISDSRTAAQSSNLGKLIFFKGATLERAQTKRVEISPCVSQSLK